MDESSSRVRTMDDKLNTTLHDSRVKFDRERARADHLIYLVQQHRYPDNIFDKIQESLYNLKRIKVRHSDIPIFYDIFKKPNRQQLKTKLSRKEDWAKSNTFPPQKPKDICYSMKSMPY